MPRDEWEEKTEGGDTVVDDVEISKFDLLGKRVL